MTSIVPSAAASHRAELIAASAIVLLDAMSFGVLTPALPFIVLHFGASAALVTQLVAISGLAVFVGGPFMGRLSDRFGRVQIIRLTFVGGVLSQIAMLLSWSLGGLFLFRVLGGLLGARSGLVKAWATDHAVEGEHIQRLGWLATAGSIGVVAGPLVGGGLALVFPDPETHFHAVMAAGVALGAAGLIPSLLFMRAGPPSGKASPAGARKEVIRPPRMLWAIALVAMTAYGYGVLTSVTALLVRARFGWGPAEVGALLGSAALVAIICRTWLLPSTVGRWGAPFTLGIALLAGAIAIAIIGTAPWRWAYLAGFLVFAVSTSLTSVIALGLVSQLAPKVRRGEILGWTQGVTALSMGLSASLNGILFEYIAPAAPYLLGSVVLAVAVAPMLLSRPPAASRTKDASAPHA